MILIMHPSKSSNPSSFNISRQQLEQATNGGIYIIEATDGGAKIGTQSPGSFKAWRLAFKPGDPSYCLCLQVRLLVGSQCVLEDLPMEE